MDLRRLLRSIQSLTDLPRLITELAHQPSWEAVPDEIWSRRGGRAFQVTAIGQTNELPWFGFESPAPGEDAVVLARQISRRARVALVLALDPASRRLGIAAAFDRCPCIELELTNPDGEALASLARLAGGSEGGSLAFAARAAEALSTEPVGRRFFREFRATLDRMAIGMPGPMPVEDRHGLVLLQLTRVLFLYFIQTKGWLGGRDRFLAEEVDGCLSRGRRVHRDLLRPLFFGTLNQPPSIRSRSALRFGPIPFLNGGLFEPHPLERRYRSDIPNPLWRDAFDSLFERFHFTVTEGGQSGKVAPDMLGRVFEGVMAPEARHASGTFYTPASLVELVLDAALGALLSARLGCTEAEADRRLHQPDQNTATVLSSVTLLDPAVGSGAFLLRALDRLSTFGPPKANAAIRKRLVLQQNLFGVDRNAAAVRLTELRLWLAVIADDPADHPQNVSPLPNLDCLIRQGDSLVDPVGLESAARVAHPNNELGVELSCLRQEVINAVGTHKRSLVRRLRHVEARVLGHALDAADLLHRSAVAECLQQARASDLFGQRRGLDRDLRERLDGLRLALRTLRQARRRLSREGEVPWFHYQTHFADVFARGGFDVVIGNPPWLRSEAIPPQQRKLLSGRYRWWRGKGRLYGNSPDLAVAFLERALELSRPGGIVAMLVPAKIVTAGYGAAARHALASTTTLHVVADLTGASEAAFDATVYPLALIAGNSAPKPNHRVRTALPVLAGSRIKQSELSGGGPWILVRSGLRRVVAALEHDHPPLGQTVTCHLGVKTGLNRVFLNPSAEIEPEVLRWAVRGRDVSAFRCQCKLRLLWGHDTVGRPIRQLPPRAKAYLEKHVAALRARRDYRGGPTWAVFRVRPAVARYRVVWPDLALRLKAMALTSRLDLERIPLNSCYVAPLSSAMGADALAAWLNSTWIGAVARLAAVPASGGFARYNAQVVAHIPLPDSALQDRGLTRLARMGRSGTAVQEDLDDLAARHLGLSSSAQGALRAVLAGAPSHRR
jgi:hypothetical protein